MIQKGNAKNRKDTKMTAIRHNETIDLLLANSSVRDFSNEPVDEEAVHTILACAQKAPTSSYLQAYSIIRGEDPAKREAGRV